MAEKIFLTKKNDETIGLQTVAIHDIGVDYIQFTNGVQICWGNKSFTSDEIDYNQNVSKASITFPKAFCSGPDIILGRQCGWRYSTTINMDAGLYVGYIYNSSAVICGSVKMDNGETAMCMYVAFGRWK